MKMRAHHLSFSYAPGEPVLRDLSLDLEEGAPLVLLGENGSGKTTLLRILAGYLNGYTGTLSIKEGECTFEPSQAWRQRNVEFVHQDPLTGLFPDLTLVENLVLRIPSGSSPIWGPYFGWARPRRLEAKFFSHVPFYGKFKHRRLASLSGGEKQLFAVGLAAASSKPFILMDEPTAALDRNAAASVKDRLREMLTCGGVSSLIVTHDKRLAGDLGFREINIGDLGS